MEQGKFLSWVISRSPFRYQSMFLNSLSESTGSRELTHRLQARPHACMSPSTFCCCCLHRRVSWVLIESREGCCEGMERFLSSSRKGLFSVALQIAWEERERLSWAAAGGFDEAQCCWGRVGHSMAGLYLFS